MKVAKWAAILLGMTVWLTAAGIRAQEECPDSDRDGYRDKACGGNDCNDLDPAIRPGAVELCDGLDNNCDGKTDEGDICKKGDVGCSSFGGPVSAGLILAFLGLGVVFLRRNHP